MIGRTIQIHEPYAPWSARVSVFAAILIATALVLHRISYLTTPVAINLIGVGFILAALAVAFGIYAATSIWVSGRSGAWSTAAGLLLGGGLWLWPVAMAPVYFSLPHINDISTDTVRPPQFTIAAKQRGPGANPATYPGAVVAVLQAKAYPDLTTLVIARSAEDVYELALDLVGGRRGLGWKVVADVAPQTRTQQAGIIEATDRTLILGFTDDVIIRVAGNDSEARVDIRSASRYGSLDFGANAARIRRFVRDLATRLEQAGPVGVASHGGVRINSAEVPVGKVKRPLDRKPTRAER